MEAMKASLLVCIGQQENEDVWDMWHQAMSNLDSGKIATMTSTLLDHYI